MLHNKALYKAILSIIPIIPFVAISSIQRGFLHGKEDMMPAGISNIVEEIVKILLIIILLPIFAKKDNITAIICLILFNIITEIISIVIMKKDHPCGTNKWEIVRLGADIKIKCLNCGRCIMLPRIEFNRKLKKVEEL